MIKGILITLVVLVILHYYGIDINDIVIKIGTELSLAWQWILNIVHAV